MSEYAPESEISPEQADKIIMAGDVAKDSHPGYRMVSMAELRKLYGVFINHDNLHMPLAQYLGMMLDVVRCMTHYKGVTTSTLPLDAWVYQEIIFERRPNVIIEIGNQCGGSTMMLRDYLMHSDIPDAKGVIGIDITHNRISKKALKYPDIKWIVGDACSQEVLEQVKDYISPKDRVMVIDDSNHEYEHTLTNLKNYSPLVTKDQYYVVEDTLLGEFVLFGKDRLRAYDAVYEFMKTSEDFVKDRNREKWFITANPEGFLVKTR
jgi:cephalosporin hydroxylase